MDKKTHRILALAALGLIGYQGYLNYRFSDSDEQRRCYLILAALSLTVAALGGFAD